MLHPRPPSPLSLWRPLPWVLIVLLVGLGLTGLATVRQQRANEAFVQERFQTTSLDLANQIVVHVERYESALRGARGVVQQVGEPLIAAADFRRFVDSLDLPRNYPGARGFGVIHRLAPADGSQRRTQLPFRELSRHEGERFVIERIEPVEDNRPALGLDIASDPVRRNAAHAALQSNRPILSAPITLVQAEDAPGQGFLLLLPLYREGQPSTTVAEREAAAYGWAYAPLLTREVLADVALQEHHLALTLTDVTDPAAPVTFFSTLARDEALRNDALGSQLTRTLYGRTWAVAAQARPGFAAQYALFDPQWVSAAGALMTLLVASLLWVWLALRHRRAQALALHARQQQAHERQLVALNAELEQRVRERTLALEEVERFLRTVLDAVPSMISYWDHDQINRTANRANLVWRRPQGGTLVGRNVRETLGEALYQRMQPHIEAVLAGGPQDFEITMPSPATGEPREMHVRFVPDLRAGEVLGYYAVIDDVTELNRSRRALEAALRQQITERARLDSILAGTDAGTWEWNVQTGELRVNERWAALLGHDYDVLRPQHVQTWQELTHADDMQVSNGLMQQHFEGENPFYECELRMRHADGHWVWVLERGQLRTRTADGQPEWMFGTTQDIGERKAAEARLRASEAFLDHVSQIAGVGGWQYDIARQRFQWSRQTQRISELPPGAVMDVQGALAFYAPEARATLLALFNRAIETGESFEHESPYTTAQGRARWVRTVGIAVRDPGNLLGPPVRLVGSLQDITECHANEQALREAKRAAEAASQSKSAFLANMSHEIRTPLHAMLGVAHLLADTALDEEQRALLAKAQAAGRALQGIVNDVLDLAKIEAGEMHLAHEPFALRTLLHEVEALYAVPARAKGLRLTLHHPPGLPDAVQGDAARLRQVLANLVGNAIKFTAQGEVAIYAGAWPADGSEQLCLSVRDSGIGIPPEVQARLFRPFTQADETITRRFGGTGLGLSIVHRLVTMMGGEVTLTSTPGSGSVFTVALPLQRAALADVPVVEAPAPGVRDLTGLRVLVVDDSEINREIAGRMLRRDGAQVRECADGAQALALLQREPDAIDAVLMDVQMPVMDGLEATRRIRADAALCALPVIALTAGALADERQRALDAGFSDFLPKPLEPSALAPTLRRLVPMATRIAAMPAVRLLEPAPAPDGGDWPPIAGIDGGLAALRLGGDAVLFRKLLGRLLEECAEWQALDATALVGADAVLRTHWRQRAHRLKGSAGMLGASALSAAASRLELALHEDAEPGGDAAQALTDLQQLFERLRGAASGTLGQAPHGAADPGGAPMPPDAQREAEARLVAQLTEQDLGALDTFAACRAGLCARLGDERVDRLECALDNLDFAGALRELDPQGQPA